MWQTKNFIKLLFRKGFNNWDIVYLHRSGFINEWQMKILRKIKR